MIKVTRESEVKWEKPFGEIDNFLHDGKAIKYYDCYSFEIVASNQYDILVRFSPELVVFKAGNILFDGLLVIEYHLAYTALDDLKKQVLAMGLDAHDRFIRLFDQKESLTELGKTHLLFDDRLMKEILGLRLFPI